jgi:hypothetical protein
MEPLENDELSDLELDRILREWNAPAAPARLRAALFPAVHQPWWRQMWSASVRVPAPAFCFLTIVIALAAWRWIVPAPSPTPGLSFNQWKPVAELRPRLIRSSNVPN